MVTESSIFLMVEIVVALLFIIGVYALLVTRNLLRILIGLEILTKGVTLLLIAAGFATGRQNSMQPIVITMIVMEVVIIAIAAGIVIASYRNNKTISARSLRNLKG